MTAIDEFTAAALRAGLHINAVNQTGAVSRVPVHGDSPGQQSGWYVFHATPPWGIIGNWRTAEKQHWSAVRQGAISDAARAELTEQVRRFHQEQRQRQAAEYMHVRGEVWRQLQASTPADPAHPYLVDMGVGAYGLRQLERDLLIPLSDFEGQIWNLQRIDAQGNKSLFADGRKHGLFHLIGSPPDAIVYIVESYANAAQILEATGHPAAIAFDADNLTPVAKSLRRQYPLARIVICPEITAETAAPIGRSRGVDVAMVMRDRRDGARHGVTP